LHYQHLSEDFVAVETSGSTVPWHEFRFGDSQNAKKKKKKKNPKTKGLFFFYLKKKYPPPPPPKFFFSRLITMHHFNIQVEFFWDFLTHEDKITMLHRNFGSQLLSDTVSYPRRMDASAELHCKPNNS